MEGEEGTREGLRGERCPGMGIEEEDKANRHNRSVDTRSRTGHEASQSGGEEAYIQSGD